MADIEREGRNDSPVAVRGPQRASSRRNFEALLAAAREVFAADGVNGSLEEIARRAGVGIGTLYRNFPTRQTLFEAVYVDEVDALARVADDLNDHDPWDALEIWLRRFVGYANTKKAIYEALNLDSPMFAACIDRIHCTGRPLLERAQDAGRARADVSFEDVRYLINGVSGANIADDAQRERVLTMALDGIRTPV
ncbi:TetR/AcrR family transcriptional regulator [Pseudonocardia sp. DLS-67]